LIVPSAVLQRSHAQSDLANTVLAVHNRERAAVGVPPVDPLVWSDKLAADAKIWAEHLATTGEFVHDTEHLPTLGEGENLAAMSWMGSHNTTVPIAQNMQGWVAEKNSYQGLPSATGTNVTGHYTQMVWRNTKEIGCATATSTASGGGRDILVCRYSPPGNIVGQKPY
jgi:Cysteine-rich secretory protein family